jgi:hypothetical protein
MIFDLTFELVKHEADDVAHCGVFLRFPVFFDLIKALHKGGGQLLLGKVNSPLTTMSVQDAEESFGVVTK